MLLLFWNGAGAGVSPPPPPPARHGGFYEEWRGHEPKRSQRDEARDIYQAVRDAFDGVKKVAPKKAAEIAPPALKADAPPVDWRALDALQRAVEAFAERQNKRSIRDAVEEYRARLAGYKAAVEAQLAQDALVAFEAEQVRLREEAIAADDEDVIALYLQWRRTIAMQAIAIVQARQERLNADTV